MGASHGRHADRAGNLKIRGLLILLVEDLDLEDIGSQLRPLVKLVDKIIAGAKRGSFILGGNSDLGLTAWPGWGSLP